MAAIGASTNESLRIEQRVSVLPLLGAVGLQLAVILVVGMGAFFAHELGHALTATVLGARVAMFNVLGVQWYPTLQWLPQLGFGGYVYWFAPANKTLHWLIVLSGSTLTLILAFTAALALWLMPFKGLARTALIVVSLYFLDGLIHLLPVLGVVRIGTSRFQTTFSEAYTAAVALGLPPPAYITLVLVSSLLILILVATALTRDRSSDVVKM